MMEEILGPQGVLAQHLPHYEHRPGQIAMAQAVQEALAKGSQLLVEAGTGTGKTLAYLIPAIYSGQKIVISTGSKNLQEQLYYKDIPFLSRHLGVKFKVCYMKGRNNYLCRRRWTSFSQQPFLTNSSEAEFFGQVSSWIGHTRQGDRSELENLPDILPFWEEICSKRELCLNQKCPHFDQCFITRMKQEAMQADLIIVNHHLFFADLALKSASYGEVIPQHDAIIFDEAHQVEETATRYFGLQVSSYQLEELALDSQRELQASRRQETELDPVLENLQHKAQRFFNSFLAWGEKFSLAPKRLETEGILPQGAELINVLGLLAANLEGLKKPSEELLACARRAHNLGQGLEFILACSTSNNYAYWGETRGRGFVLHASPLDISLQLENELYQKTDTVILTSATLAIQGNFAFCKNRLGLQNPAELIIPEHFDYQRQVAIYLPPDLPYPTQASFCPAIARQISQILSKTAGRALVLFTSYQQLEQVYQELHRRLPFTLLRQGEQPKTVLLKKFQQDLQSVLLATSSFWQGVDVPGEALSCLIVARLPFAVPSEPLLEARLAHIRQEGGNPFTDYQLPSAAILLRQGFGRLIRNQKDKGVLVILDKRITHRGYGRVFLDSLPPCRRLHSPEEIKHFLAETPSQAKLLTQLTPEGGKSHVATFSHHTA